MAIGGRVRWPQQHRHTQREMAFEIQVWGIDRSVLPDFTVGGRKLSIRTER